jgi:hypothetical protein
MATQSLLSRSIGSREPDCQVPGVVWRPTRPDTSSEAECFDRLVVGMDSNPGDPASRRGPCQAAERSSVGRRT